VVTLLKTKGSSTTGPRALDFLWGLNAVGGLNEQVGRELLTHPEPAVREWIVRLLGDRNEVSSEMATALANMAALEPDVHVRSQLASSARRLRAEDDLAIIGRLAEHGEDVKDPHVPLLVWWAIEAKVEKS